MDDDYHTKRNDYTEQCKVCGETINWSSLVNGQSHVESKVVKSERFRQCHVCAAKEHERNRMRTRLHREVMG